MLWQSTKQSGGLPMGITYRIGLQPTTEPQTRLCFLSPCAPELTLVPGLYTAPGSRHFSPDVPLPSPRVWNYLPTDLNQTASVIMQPFQTVAEDAFIWALDQSAVYIIIIIIIVNVNL